MSAALKWHVCPECVVAGWAPEGSRYCRLHGGQPLDESLPSSPPTAIEKALGRRIFADPPNLRDWIRRFGGYAKITAEGWAEYAAAMAEWREAKPAIAGQRHGARITTPQTRVSLQLRPSARRPARLGGHHVRRCRLPSPRKV